MRSCMEGGGRRWGSLCEAPGMTGGVGLLGWPGAKVLGKWGLG